ncbi:MAG: ParA family protein [Thermoproteus sp.]
MKTLAFISGLKGGTGKTTLAVNTAVVLAYALRGKAKYPVVLIDTTPGIGTAAMLLAGSYGLQNMASLSEYFEGRISNPLQALYLRRWQVQQGEFNVVFSFMNKPVAVSRRLLEALMRQIGDMLGPLVAILDSPPAGYDWGAAGLLDFIVPVVTPDMSSIMSTAGVAKIVGGRVLRPIINMYIKDHDVAGVYGRNWPDMVRDMFGEEPHIIPADPLFEASRQALEIESLKLRPEESQGLAALLSYIRYLASQLSI